MAVSRHDQQEASQQAREDRRQRAVESLGILDQPPSERLDRITRLARTVFGVPITAITVLDRDRAWNLSLQGLEIRDSPRTGSFCQVPTALDETVICPDATRDPRFAHLEAVSEHGLRFYAGHPLRDSNDNVVAVFCILDTTPRTLDAEQLSAFEDMAAWAQQEVVSSSEMARAGEVQASMLPEQAIVTGGWEIRGACLPALAVGGDFFDHGVIQDVAHLAIGDVMGKGTGAALVGAGARAALRSTHAVAAAGVDLGITVTQVARSLLQDLERTESFITLFQGVIDLSDGELRFVDAGMNLTLLVRADGETVHLHGQGLPIGVLPDSHWDEQQVDLEPGDRLLVFSDGLLDLLDAPEDWVPEVRELVLAHDTASSLLAGITRMARRRTALDDVTAVAVYRESGDAGTTR
ncbi:PP2C family protein-serine/threonine phosphatase [Nocardioides pacificus]